MDTSILPSVTYACQTWTYTNKIKNKIRTCQRAMERSLTNIKKIERVKSDDIRLKTNVTDAVIHALKLKWKWAGHVSRYKDNRWTQQAATWKGPKGKRRTGRPKKRWADDIIEIAGCRWTTIAQNRVTWNNLEEAFTLKGSTPHTNT